MKNSVMTYFTNSVIYTDKPLSEHYLENCMDAITRNQVQYKFGLIHNFYLITKEHGGSCG